MTASRQVLTRAHIQLLADFLNAGGSGTLDMHARVCCGTPREPLRNADSATWLKLVAEGMVAGEHGRILLTEAGRDACAAIADGYVRHSS